MDQPFDAVLFDRDGTLIRDVPYNGDPNRVTPMPGARELLRRFGTWQICPHLPDEGCPERTLVVGDIGSDVGAAQAAGAVPVLEMIR